METHTVTLGEKEIHIADYPGEKGPIIAIHGLTGNKYQLQFFAEHFSPRYRVITMDLRGRGDSSSTDQEPSIFKHAEDITQFLKEQEIEKPILMGYSMGGFVSALVASRYEVGALILLDGAATMSDHQKPIVEPSFQRLGRPFLSKEDYIEQTAGSYANLDIPRTQELLDLLAYEVEEVDGNWYNKAVPEGIKGDWATFWQFEAGEVFSQVDAPVLLVQASGNIGANPPLFLAEHYQKTIAAAKDITVVESDASHYTMVFEERADINSYIDDFLEANNL